MSISTLKSIFCSLVIKSVVFSESNKIDSKEFCMKIQPITFIAKIVYCTLVISAMAYLRYSILILFLRVSNSLIDFNRVL